MTRISFFEGLVTTILSSDEEDEMDSCHFHEDDFDAELHLDGFALVFTGTNVAHLVEVTLAVA